jgi:hypothetical protein
VGHDDAIAEGVSVDRSVNELVGDLLGPVGVGECFVRRVSIELAKQIVVLLDTE